MIIIPIGIQCATTTFKNKIQKTHTLPFDWMFATPRFVFEILVLLLEQNMNLEELVKNHFFYCEKRANMTEVEHYYTCDDGFALYNSKYNVIFPHDENNIENINKYIRRFERLKDIILHSNEELCFIYTSPSSSKSGNFTIDGNIVINDVYLYLSKIYSLIGKYRNGENNNLDYTPLNNSIRTADEFSSKLPVTDLYGAPHRGANSNLRSYKLFLFDAIQEENPELLHKNIILCKLQKCDSWVDLIPQMKNYV